MAAEIADVWDPILDAITMHRPRDLLVRLHGLDAPARKALVAPLRALARTPAGGLPPWDIFGGLAIAGAAVLPDARTTAAWLRRFEARDFVPSATHKTERYLYDEVAEVLLTRNAPWLGRLVELWAEGLRINIQVEQPYLVVERLRRRLDLDPVVAHGYDAGWVGHEWVHRRADPVAKVRSDPRFAALVPIVLEIDEVLPALRAQPDPLLRVTATDGVDRGAVLDAALGRLQRGGRPAATDALVHLYRALEPSLEETHTRVRDLIALIPGTRSLVAGLAQESLFALHDAGLLSGRELAEVSSAVFARTEKKLLRAQLARLKAHAAAHPEDSSLVARAAAGGLTNPAVDIQRDTLTLLTRLTKNGVPLGASTIEAIRDAGQFLPPDLVPLLTGVLGEPALADAAHAAPGLPPAPPRPATQRLTPISSTEELIEGFLTLVRAEGNQMRASDLERVIEGIPRLAGTDAFRHQAGELLADEEHSWVRMNYEYISSVTVRRGLFALLAAGFGDPLPAFVDAFSNRDPALQRAISTRLFSLAGALAGNALVRVVSFPTWTTGSITAPDLLHRLRAAADLGLEPAPLDLEQALLRLDLRSVEDGHAPFTDLGTAAGTRAGAWIAARGGTVPPHLLSSVPEHLETRYMARRATSPAPEYVTLPTLAASTPSEGAGVLWRLAFSPETRPHGFAPRWEPDAAYDAWPLVLPHHRDTVAVHLAPELVRATSASSPAGPALIRLAEADGPVGRALFTALAYALAAKDARTRAAAVDALLILAVRGELVPDELAAVLVILIRNRDITMGRLLVPLLDLARAGAPHHVWSTLRPLVGDLVGDPPQGLGLADLLALAAEVALLDPVEKAPVPGLDVFASRKGSGRQLTEARRLVALLENR